MNFRFTFAEGIPEALERERKKSPLDNHQWTDAEADRFCEVSRCLYAMYPSEDTLCEPHVGYTLVWNRYGLWRVYVKRGVVKQIV